MCLEGELRVLIVPHTGKTNTAPAARELAEWLASQGHEVLLTPDDAEACGLAEHAVPQSALGAPGLAVALGGDGTIIKTVHALGDEETPILGVNFGRVGFLSGAESEDLLDAVSAALEGKAHAERRMTLQVTVVQGGREVGHYTALNEVFVGRRGASRVADLTLSVNGSEVVTYTCDGLIVASPTGSTAYALSAGGPIVSPDVRALVLVPVAPHTLADRALVLGPDDRLDISCPDTRKSDVCLTVDGAEVPCRLALERVTVWRGDRDVTLLRLDGRAFLDVASRKFLGA